MNRGTFKFFFFAVLIFIVGTFIYRLSGESKVEIVQNCKVMKLQQQSLLEGHDSNLSTKIRYLVITDKETFVCESSMLNGKFNNSDIFWRLKEDSTYTFKVCGIGKTMFSEYRNILDVE